MLFIDAGAWVALYIVRDENHERAEQAWARLRRDRPPLLTSNLVIAEVATLLMRRLGAEVAVERVRRIYRSSAIQIIRSTEEDEMNALVRMVKYADQYVGFVDCVSFVLMERLVADTAFTFDHHYSIAGFKMWPE